MKEKGVSPGGSSHARNSQAALKKIAATGKTTVKHAASGKFTSLGSVSILVVGSPGAGKRASVSVFRVPNKASLTRSQKLLRQAPHLGHRTLAVVSPKVFNEPDLRRAIVEDYSDVLVEEPGEIAITRLVRFLEKSSRSVLKEQLAKQHRETMPDRTLSEAATTDLSARLRDASGRLDAKKISDLLGIRMTDLATKVCGVTKQALGQSPTSAGIQGKLQPLEDIAQLLHWCGGDEAKLRAWLKRPNPDFPEIDGKTPSPVDLILRGHSGIVARKVHNLRTGHPA
ncbi:hypothetical protein [Luteolibacter sp. Populi]|uniref:hypothetical protein n=1 Tax=Luteolibacter sp. Populi TaxID=3230487 RepID=UPI003465D109